MLEGMEVDALSSLYTAHYRKLVRLAAHLTSDRDSAEEVVQDAYVKMHGSWRGLRTPTRPRPTCARQSSTSPAHGYGDGRSPRDMIPNP